MTRGFTLAELLMALAILGVIATFTIPKVLYAGQQGQYAGVAKEDIAAISGAYESYKLNNVPGSGFTMDELTPFLNYVKVDSTTLIDDNPGDSASLDCASYTCLVMHNGSILLYHPGESMGGTNTNNALFIQIDPNGRLDVNSLADGPGKGVEIRLFYNGRVTSVENIPPNTCDSWACNGPVANGDPSWFTW
ncbi:MAG: type II secretion system protein [Candidatus Melainabacteria bacterium]